MSNPNARRTLGVLFALLLAAASAQAVTLKERFDKTVPVQAGARVALANVNGGVTFAVWDRNEVRIEAEKQVRAGSDSEARKVMSQVRIEITQEAGGVRIATRTPKRNDGFFDWIFGNQVNVGVTYKVHVPRQAGIDAETVNGGISLNGTRGKVRLETVNGAIDIRNVAGDVDASTTNGAISAARIAGAVHAGTTNGAIEAELTDVPDGSDLRFETTNGSVTVRLPGSARLTVDAGTTNGGIDCDLPVEGGRKTRRSLTGDINGGGGQLIVRTTNGGIDILEQ